MVRSIGVRAGDIVLAVARACRGARDDMAAALESDLQQLTGCAYPPWFLFAAVDWPLFSTMNDVYDLTAEMAARPGYKRLLYKMEDAGAIKALDTQLTHAFQVFEVRRSFAHLVVQLRTRHFWLRYNPVSVSVFHSSR